MEAVIFILPAAVLCGIGCCVTHFRVQNIEEQATNPGYEFIKARSYQLTAALQVQECDATKVS